MAPVARFEDRPELLARHRHVPQVRRKTEGPPDVLERDVADDVIVDAQRTAVDEGKLRARLAERAAHLVGDEITPVAFLVADRDFAAIQRHGRPADPRHQEGEALEQHAAPFLLQLRVVGIRFDRFVEVDDPRVDRGRAVSIEAHVDAPDPARIRRAFHDRGAVAAQLAVLGFVLVPARDEHELRVLGAQRGNLDIRPHVQVRQADDEIGTRRVQCPDGALGVREIVRLGRHVIAIVAALAGVQQQPENAHLAAARFEHELLVQRTVDVGLAGREPVVVADPVEIRRPDGLDEMIRRARIELVVTGDDVHRRQRVHVVEGIDDLHAVPGLPPGRRIREVPAMNDAHVAALCLQFPHQRHHPAEPAGAAVFDGPDTVGVVQVQEGEAGRLSRLLRRRGARNEKQHAQGDERDGSVHGFALSFEFRGILPQKSPPMRLRILRAATMRA